MDRMLEVRVRTGIPLWLIGIAGLGLGMATGQAQTQATQPTANPAPATQTVPAPTPESQDKTNSAPAYGGQASPGATQTMPAPQQAPAPAVTTAPPTPQTPYTAMPAYAPDETPEKPGRARSDPLGSAYIPVDNWVYPAMMRLYSMGYLDTMFLSVRPYTRRSALHILQQSEDAILTGDEQQAQDILAALLNELSDEGIGSKAPRGMVYGLQSVYTRVQGVAGPILQDSYHLGQTFFNDYGRPHETGFNNITGFSTLEERGPFSLYVRGEYQHAPGGPGYSQALSTQLSTIDQIVPFAPPNYPQATIPMGPIAAQNPFRLVEATLSYHILGHEISGGKSDAWLGPAMGGGMAWSNNAENIYSFRINRIEPLQPEGAYLSERRLHALGDRGVPADARFSVQPAADNHLRRRRPRAGDAAHVFEGIFRHQRHEYRSEVFARRSGGAILRLQLLLPAAVGAELSHALSGFGDA
jgi:hypothetical protein